MGLHVTRLLSGRVARKDSSHVPVTLRTARLVLRPATVKDIGPLHLLWTEADVRRYLWDDLVVPIARVAEVVTCSDVEWRSYGYGIWTVRCELDEPLIGFCGFRTAEWRAAPELLFGLTRSVWGNGYALEAASTALGYALDTLRVPEVVAATDGANCASVRVLERLMHFERRGLFHALDTLFYRVLRAV